MIAMVLYRSIRQRRKRKDLRIFTAHIVYDISDFYRPVYRHKEEKTIFMKVFDEKEYVIKWGINRQKHISYKQHT